MRICALKPIILEIHISCQTEPYFIIKKNMLYNVLFPINQLNHPVCNSAGISGNFVEAALALWTLCMACMLNFLDIALWHSFKEILICCNNFHNNFLGLFSICCLASSKTLLVKIELLISHVFNWSSVLELFNEH